MNTTADITPDTATISEPGLAPSPPTNGSVKIPPRMRDLALAAIAGTLGAAAGHKIGGEPGEVLLREVREDVRHHGDSLAEVLEGCLHSPAPQDDALFSLAAELHLSPLEMLAVALAAAVEDDLLIGRSLAHIQAPVGGSRPTLGLMAHAFMSALGRRIAVLPTLLSGAAFRTGLLTAPNETVPLPERTVMLPLPISLALSGRDGQWPGATIGLDDNRRVPLAESTVLEAQRHAVALQAQPQRTLVIRAGSTSEGRSVAAALADALEYRPVFLEAATLTGIGPWLLLRRLLPVFCLELSPGERHSLPELPGYRGPAVVLCGPDGSIETETGAAANWALSVPRPDERRALWQAALGDQPLAEEMGTQFRHGAGRIAHLGRLAHHHADLADRREPTRQDILSAAWSGEGAGLDALAEALCTQVPDEALITAPTLQRDLDALLLRCRLRDELVAGLGASAITRYRPGLRALFTGPSGTGKTLAAGWVATRLGLPLYRVDLASVTSKYIGETEKNLSQLLARAEQAEVILLFDEADSLFGKRTEVSDSNDRFANAQTNYLLQRIENYDGIVLMTSNSQSRFDPAFSRRLDFTLEFPKPGPEERRALWKSHLGPDTDLQPAQLNQLAVLLDLNGGHIRNAVLAAAVLARHTGQPITFADVLDGVVDELRKLGRQLPMEFTSLTRRGP